MHFSYASDRADTIIEGLNPNTGNRKWTVEPAEHIRGDGQSPFLMFTNVMELPGEDRLGLNIGDDIFSIDESGNFRREDNLSHPPGLRFRGTFSAGHGYWLEGATVIKHDFKNDSTEWSFEAYQEVTTPVKISGKIALFGTQNNTLYAVDLSDGEELWSFSAENSIWTSPLIGDDVVYVGSRDDSVYAVTREDGSVISSIDVGADVGPLVSVGNTIGALTSDGLFGISSIN